MTAKGKDGRILFILTLLLFSFSSQIHAKGKPTLSQLNGAQVAYDENSLFTGKFEGSDGNSWNAIYSSKSEKPKMIFGCDCPVFEGSAEMIAYDFLISNSESLGLTDPYEELDISRKITSPGSTHIVYKQMYNGLDVFDSAISVHIANQGRIELVNNSFKESDEIKVENEDSLLTIQNLIDIIKNDLGSPILDGEATFTLGILELNNKYYRTYRIVYPAISPLGDWIYDIDAKTGTIYSRTNALKFFEGKAYLHIPNPYLSPSKKEVKISNISSKNPASGFELLGPFFTVVDSLAESVFEIDPVFNYEYIFDDRTFDESPFSDPRYEQVLVYYLLESFRSYYRNLGFHFFTNYKLTADAHGTPEDISYYSQVRKKLTYGYGGINDASDGDVILHELSHAALDFVKPSLIHVAGETAALHEGYADYLTASYFDNPCIGEWDSKPYSQTGCIRNITDQKNYPNDLTGVDHEDSIFWSSALWEIRNKINEKKTTDKLVAKSMFFLADSGSSFKEAAFALLTAEKNLYNEKYSNIIQDVLQKRGLIKKSEFASIQND